MRTIRGRIPIIFTAHSLPRPVVDRDPGYITQLRDTAAAIAHDWASTDERWSFAYQSAGHTPEEWLTPDVKDLFPGFAPTGSPRSSSCPCSSSRTTSRSSTTSISRPERRRRPRVSPCIASRCPNTQPAFIRALAAVVDRERAGAASDSCLLTRVVTSEDRFAAKGTVEPGFETVREAFADVLAEQRGTGAALAVWHDGRWIVDLWGGAASADGTRPWQRNSIVQPYSVSKPFAAMCALVLIDRGLLDLDAPVQRYWPEFTAPATARHVLSHQAGVVALSAPARTDLFYDWGALCALLAAQRPEWPPGTAHGESALFYGHLVGEIVRRIDGRGIGRFLRDEVCRPAGLDFIVGLTPEDQSRAVDLTCLEAIESHPGDLYARATNNPPGTRDAAVVNGAAWRAAEVPAVNGHGTARGIAGLYAALLGGQLLSPGAVSRSRVGAVRGRRPGVRARERLGLGFAVDAEGFGMGGSGGSYGGACTRGGYAIAFVTGTMGTHARGERVENALRSRLGLPPI